MANAWVEFVKKWSKDNNETYSCAVSLPACREAYQATKPPKKAKKLTQKQEREAMGAEDVASTAQRAEASASLSRKKASINKGKTILKAKLAKKDVEKELVAKFPAYTENKSMKQELVSMGAEDRNVAVPKGDVVAVRPRGRPKKYATAEEAKEAKATKTVEAKKKRQATKKAEKEAKKAKPTENIQMVLENQPSPTGRGRRGGMGQVLSRRRRVAPEPVARIPNMYDRVFPATPASLISPDVREIGIGVPIADAEVLPQAPSRRDRERGQQRFDNIQLLERVKINLRDDFNRLRDRIGSRTPTSEEREQLNQLRRDFRETEDELDNLNNLTFFPQEDESSSQDSLPSDLSWGSVLTSPTGRGRRGGKSPCMNGKELKGNKCVKIGGAVEVSNPEINNDWFRNYAQRLNPSLINYKGLADSIAHPNIAQVRDLVGKINGLIG